MMSRYRKLFLLIVSVVLLALAPAAALAGTASAAAPAHVETALAEAALAETALAETALALPPLPEWPIVGPLLQRLGLVAPPQPVEVTPDPSLPEYRIVDFEDLERLEGVEDGERIRIIVAEADLNRMIEAAIESGAQGEASVVVGLNAGTMDVDIKADTSVLEQGGLNVPRQLQGDLDLVTTLHIQTSQCVPEVAITRLRLNRLGLGLRPIAQRALNTSLPEIWPADLCLERVILTSGEVAVEGYRGS